jgi:hypothetical protein
MKYVVKQHGTAFWYARINTGRVLLALVCLAVGSAKAEMTWRSTPEIVSENEHEGGGHRHGGELKLYLREGEGAELTLRTPDLQVRPLALMGQAAVIRPTGLDGYHLALAHRTFKGKEEAAFRYFYVPGKPSGHSPAEQVNARTVKLRILPMPLPREHWRYESGESATFRVIFNGKPLAQEPLRLTTSNGSLLDATTNEDGEVSFVLPEDFSRVRPGRESNRPADFVVTSTYSDEGRTFITTLSADYHVNPRHWQSRWGGLGALALGFVVGLRVVRRRQEANA